MTEEAVLQGSGVSLLPKEKDSCAVRHEQISVPKTFSRSDLFRPYVVLEYRAVDAISECHRRRSRISTEFFLIYWLTGNAHSRGALCWGIESEVGELVVGRKIHQTISEQRKHIG